MATAIVKKCKRRGNMSISQYVREILDYISAPTTNKSPDDNSQSSTEKCTSFMFLNPYTLDDTILNDKSEIYKSASIAKKLIIDLLESKEKFKSNDKIMSHFVMSFQNTGRQPTEKEIMLAVKHFLTDMGYSDENFAAAAIHKNTKHLHVHIVMCRASAMNPDGNLVREGNYWWKNESQRFLARECDRQPGVFELDPGVAKRVKKDGSVYNIIKSLKKSGCTDIDGAQERRTRKISYNRLLGFILDEVYNKIQNKWKWGNLYKALAEQGVFVEVRQHGNTKGLTFSLDGKNWRAASQFGARWTIKELSKAISGGFRNPRDKIRSIAEKVREQYPLEDLINEYVVIDDTTSTEAQHDTGKDTDHPATHAEATANTGSATTTTADSEAATAKTNINLIHADAYRTAGERYQNMAGGRARKVQGLEQSGGKSGEGIQGPEGSNTAGMRDTAGTGRRERPEHSEPVERNQGGSIPDSSDGGGNQKITRVIEGIHSALTPLPEAAPPAPVPEGPWLSLAAAQTMLNGIALNTIIIADMANRAAERRKAEIRQEAEAIQTIRSALVPLPEAAPPAPVPEGPWLSLAAAQTMLHCIARNTLTIADMADQAAERRKAEIRHEAQATQTIRSALVPLPTAVPPEPVPEGPWLSLAAAQTMLQGIARNTLTIADMADQAAERRKAEIRQEAEAIQTIRSALVPLPTPAPPKAFPEGPWLSLAAAQTVLHGIARNTLMIADMANQAAERRKAGIGQQAKAIQTIRSALVPLPTVAPPEPVPEGPWLSLAAAQTMLQGIARNTLMIADMADQAAERRKAGIRQQAKAIQTIRSALVPLPTAAPPEPVPEGPWLSLVAAQTMLHGIAGKTLTIKNRETIAIENATVEEDGKRYVDRLECVPVELWTQAAQAGVAEISDSGMDVFMVIPNSEIVPSALPPIMETLSTDDMKAAEGNSTVPRVEYGGFAGRSPVVDGRGIRVSAEPAGAHERAVGSVGTAGPTGTGDGTPIAPAPDAAAWKARLIQRMRQSTTTAREPALPPTPEPAEISTPDPEDDAAWEELFLERIRRKQAAQTARERMEEMEERPDMPTSPPPRVRKRSIDPQMPEW